MWKFNSNSQGFQNMWRWTFKDQSQKKWEKVFTFKRARLSCLFNEWIKICTVNLSSKPRQTCVMSTLVLHLHYAIWPSSAIQTSVSYVMFKRCHLTTKNGKGGPSSRKGLTQLKSQFFVVYLNAFKNLPYFPASSPFMPPSSSFVVKALLFPVNPWAENGKKICKAFTFF